MLERDEANVQDAAYTFWNHSKKAGVTALEERNYILRLIHRFIQGDDKDTWMDSLAREKLIQGLPKEGRQFVKERRPETSMEAARLAERFFEILLDQRNLLHQLEWKFQGPGAEASHGGQGESTLPEMAERLGEVPKGDFTQQRGQGR